MGTGMFSATEEGSVFAPHRSRWPLRPCEGFCKALPAFQSGLRSHWSQKVEICPYERRSIPTPPSTQRLAPCMNLVFIFPKHVFILLWHIYVSINVIYDSSLQIKKIYTVSFSLNIIFLRLHIKLYFIYFIYLVFSHCRNQHNLSILLLMNV